MAKMKAKVSILALLVLFSVLSGVLIVQSGARNGFVQAETSNVMVLDGSPSSSITMQPLENKSYNTNNITTQFSIGTPITPSEAYTYSYAFSPSRDSGASSWYAWIAGTKFVMVGANLDFETQDYVSLFDGSKLHYPAMPASLPISVWRNGTSSDGTLLSQGTVSLTNLTQGAHHLTVWIEVVQSEADGSFAYTGSVYSTVWFNVDSIPPCIKILSPNATTTYNASKIPLDFTINENVSKLTYSLDNGTTMAAMNTTLTGLSNGAHNLTIFATDEVGIRGNQTVTFNVQDATAYSLNFSGLLLAFPVAAFVIVLVLFVYFRRRKLRSIF